MTNYLSIYMIESLADVLNLALRHSGEHRVERRGVVRNKPDLCHSALRITLNVVRWDSIEIRS